MTIETDREAEAGIVAAALDYYEGWFDGTPERMERALHPELAKRSLDRQGVSITTLSARQMIGWTADGVGKDEDPGDRQISVHVDHIHGSIATATVTSAVYVDYLQLVRTDGEWQVLNVLWAPA